MSKLEKTIERLKSRPKDFTYSEAKRILESFGYNEYNKGKTSGSRVIFSNEDKDSILLHKPHPGNELKLYVIDQLIDFLSDRGLI
jgi:hypothetical protein